MLDDAGMGVAMAKELTSDWQVVDRLDGQPAGRPLEGVAEALTERKLVECGSLRWYVARCQTYDDQNAAQRLRYAGFNAHAFREEVRRRRQITVLQPLFPTYLFVQASVDRGQIGRLLRLKHPSGAPVVKGIIASTDGVPLPVPPGRIEELLQDADGKDIWSPPIVAVPMASAVGGVFEVLEGPWWRHKGVCIRDRHGKLDLELTLFGRDVAVKMLRHQVKAVA